MAASEDREQKTSSLYFKPTRKLAEEVRHGACCRGIQHFWASCKYTRRRMALSHQSSSRSLREWHEDEEAVLSRLEGLSEHEVFKWHKDDSTALHDAAATGHSQVCERLLALSLQHERPLWPNTQDEDGQTALHVAAAHGHTSCCQVLLLSTAFTAASASNNAGSTALHVAAEAGFADVCCALLDATVKGRLWFVSNWAFCDVDQADPDGLTALHVAARAGHVDAVHTLTEHAHYANVMARDKWSKTALHHAAFHGHLEVCAVLFASPRARGLANEVDSDGNTALHIAAGRGHAEVSGEVLKHAFFSKADVQNLRGRTALHEAVACGSLACCQTVANTTWHAPWRGQLPVPVFTNIGARDSDGRTALHLAAIGQHLEICQVLLDSVCQEDTSNLLDNRGRTPLHYAAESGNGKVYAAILEDQWFSNEDAVDEDGNTAYDLASGDVREHLLTLAMIHGRRQNDASILQRGWAGTS